LGRLVDKYNRPVDRYGNLLDIWGNPMRKPGNSSNLHGYRPQDRRDYYTYNDWGTVAGRRGYILYKRTDLNSWPQSSLRFSYGLLGEYVRWRGGTRGIWGIGIEAVFGFVDDNLRASLSVNPRLTRRDLEMEAVTVIRSYVDSNVTSLVVQDGEYYVQYRTQSQDRASSDEDVFVRAFVTEAQADTAVSAAAKGEDIVPSAQLPMQAEPDR
jgi:hypothetical protein